MVPPRIKFFSNTAKSNDKLKNPVRRETNKSP